MKLLLWCNSESSWRLAPEGCIYSWGSLEGCGNREDRHLIQGMVWGGVCQRRCPTELWSRVEFGNSWSRRAWPSVCLQVTSAQGRMSWEWRRLAHGGPDASLQPRPFPPLHRLFKTARLKCCFDSSWIFLWTAVLTVKTLSFLPISVLLSPAAECLLLSCLFQIRKHSLERVSGIWNPYCLACLYS